MNDFYNVEYLSERVAALAKERDELRKIVEKQARLNRTAAVMAMDKDRLEAERDDIIGYMREMFGHCAGCIHYQGLAGCASGEMETCEGENDRWKWGGPRD